MAYRLSNYPLRPKGMDFAKYCSGEFPPIENAIGLAKIDPTTMIFTKEQLIPVETTKACDWCHGYEDPRIFAFNGNVYLLVVSRNERGVFEPSLIELGLDLRFQRILKLRPDVDPYHHQKNWNPFIYKEELFAVASIQPHRIFRIDLDTGGASRVYETHTELFQKLEASHFIRGGSSYLRFGSEYVGICRLVSPRDTHFSNFEYRCIIYSFEASPPFQIKRRSSSFWIDDGTNQYCPLQMVTGIAEVENDVLIAYGENDWEMMVARTPREWFYRCLLHTSNHDGETSGC